MEYPLGKIKYILPLLNIDIDINRFSSRKQIQKIVYLLQAFGIKLGFDFSWYIHGPYCKELTRALYDEELDNASPFPISPEERKILKTMMIFLETDIQSPRMLELIASLHYLMNIGLKKGNNQIEIVNTLRIKKPFFPEELANYFYTKIFERFFNTQLSP